jgi:ketosteroid isomerase-like protein
MSQENVETVRGQFDATNRRDFAAAMDAYAEDVELYVPPGNIRGGTYCGRQAVGEWFGDWFRTFGSATFELLETIDADDAVVVVARHVAEGKRSGIALTDLFFYAYWVRDGKVARVQFCASRDEALEAVGLSE